MASSTCSGKHAASAARNTTGSSPSRWRCPAPPLLPDKSIRHRRAARRCDAAPLEAGQMGERLDEAVLHGVERVRLIAEKPVGHAVGEKAVALEQLIQRRAIPAGETGEQQVIARDRRRGDKWNSHGAALLPKN